MKLLFLLAMAASAAAQSGPCTAEGLVLEDGNGAPLARARVLFRKTGANSSVALGYFTDDNGRFRAQGLDAASYSVSVHKVGFLPPLATRRQRSGAIVNPGKTCEERGLQYLMVPSAVLTGRLIDANGLPAARGRVEAQRRAWLNGRWQFRTVSVGGANEQGEFRISRLPAGQYVLRAFPAGPMTVSFRDPSGPTHYMAPAYYPGVYEPAKARMISVASGVEQGGFDFGPLLVPLFTVSGQVLSAEGQGAPAYCQVLLRPVDGFGEERVARYAAQTGEFSLADVAPGRYRLMAYSAGTATIGTASRELEVTENDAAGLQLQLEPPFSVQGRAALQGGSLPLGAITVNLLPASPKVAAASPGLVEEDGSFTIPLVGHDRYRVAVTSAQPNIYLRSVTAGGKPQPGHWIDWTLGGPRQIGVLLANDGGRLEGAVAGGPGPAENVYAVLAPADMERLAGSTLIVGQVGVVGQGGPPESRFRITSIPPGDYLVYAFGIPFGDSGSDPAMLADPAWVPFYRGTGTPVRIEPNSLARVTLTILPLP
jgi:hypothetical protein